MNSIICERRHDCDVCLAQGYKSEAEYDGQTVMGPWGFMCSPCFHEYGVGVGYARGQRLIYPEDDE